jgi:hypothetical protein
MGIGTRVLKLGILDFLTQLLVEARYIVPLLCRYTVAKDYKSKKSIQLFVATPLYIYPENLGISGA